MLVGADEAAPVPAELAGIETERLLRVDGDRLLGDPRAELRRLCASSPA